MSKFKNYKESFLMNNGVMKIIAFVSAFIFWFLVVGIESPDIEKEYYNIPVSVSLSGSVAEANGLTLADSVAPLCNVTVTGVRSAIASYSKEKIKASVDFSSVTVPGTYTLPVDIELDSTEISLVETTLSEITLKIDKTVTKSVDITVNSHGSVAEGYILDSVKTYPTSLLITGPESAVSLVEKVTVEFDLNGTQKNEIKKLPFDLRDADGEIIENVLIKTDESQITVTANVFKTKEVALSYSLYNTSGGSDSLFANIAISPQKVLISGEDSVISRISTIDLGSTDASGISDQGYTVTLPIPLENGVRLVDDISEATVNVTYPDDVAIITKTVTLTADNVIPPAGKKVTLVTKSVKVTLRASSDVQSLADVEITPVIDLSAQDTKGTIKADIVFELPDNVPVAVKGNYKATVTIK